MPSCKTSLPGSPRNSSQTASPRVGAPAKSTRLLKYHKAPGRCLVGGTDLALPTVSPGMNTNLRYGYFVALLALCVGVPLLATGLWHYALPTLLVAALVLWREWRLDPAVPFLFSALVFGMFT